MNKDDILAKMQCIFREIFDDDSLVITLETTAKDIDGWDSLEQINLISSFEDAFEIEFGIDEIIAFKKVGDVVESISKKLS